jgi:hypothetical protein
MYDVGPRNAPGGLNRQRSPQSHKQATGMPPHDIVLPPARLKILASALVQRYRFDSGKRTVIRCKSIFLLQRAFKLLRCTA